MPRREERSRSFISPCRCFISRPLAPDTLFRMLGRLRRSRRTALARRSATGYSTTPAAAPVGLAAARRSAEWTISDVPSQMSRTSVARSLHARCHRRRRTALPGDLWQTPRILGLGRTCRSDTGLPSFVIAMRTRRSCERLCPYLPPAASKRFWWTRYKCLCVRGSAKDLRAGDSNLSHPTSPGRFPNRASLRRLALNLSSPVPYSVQWNNVPDLREAVGAYHRTIIRSTFGNANWRPMRRHF